MTVSIRPVGQGSTSPEGLSALLNEIRDAITELQTPQGPVPAWAALQAELPPAADHLNAVALVTDIPVLAYSDGTDWIRADNGAPV